MADDEAAEAVQEAPQMTQEELLAEQKKNCIFCRIVAGDMEGKKVFENDRFLAILDIRPAALGHVLLLPKEHVPILPLLSQTHMQELFELTAKMSAAVRETLAAQYVTVFSASGFAAGQQAPHLMLHIIPRTEGDGLEMLDVRPTMQQPDAVALSSLFEEATSQALTQLGRGDVLAPTQQETVEEQPSDVVEFDDTNDALQALLAENEELKRLIIAEPALVEGHIQKSEKLKKLFSGVNVKALSIALRRQEEKDTPVEQRTATDLTEEELFNFIDGNEGLRKWLLEHPEELANNIAQNPRLQTFFDGVDIVELAAKYKEYKDA